MSFINKKSFFTIILFFICFSGCNKNSSDKNEKNRTINHLKTYEETKDLSLILLEEKEAKEKSDILGLAQAYSDKINYFNLRFNRDSSIHYAFMGDQILDRLEGQSIKINEQQTEQLIYLKKNFASSIIDYYLSTNKCNLALIYLDKITKGEYFCIGSPSFDSQIYYFIGLTYLLSKKAEKALENFKQSYTLLQKSSDKTPYAYYRSFKGMSHALFQLKKYDEMIALNDSVNQMVDKEQELRGEKSYKYYCIKYSIFTEFAGGYIKIGDLETTRKKLDEANKILTEHLKDSPHKFVHYQIESQYYLAKKEYNKAKKYMEYPLKYVGSKEQEGAYNYLETNRQQAEIMRQAGEAEEAYDLLSELYELNDSTHTANFSSQVAEIESNYKVDKMKLETERSKEELRKMKFILAGGFLTSILLIYILYSYRRNSNILKEKNKQLFKKLSELEDNNKKIKELQQKKNNQIKRMAESKDSYDDIIDSLNFYMERSQVYRQPGISREDIAVAIGTNRQYLIEAIKEKTGKTFNEFLYSFRLKYAFNSIVNEKEKNIAKIYTEAGFLSYATFYRTFKEHYGMTPSELRNASK